MTVSMKETASRWVAREALGALSASDRQALNAWLMADPANRNAYLTAKGVMESLRGKGAESALRSAHGARFVSRARSPGAARRYAGVGALAASVAALTVFAFSSEIVSITADHASSPGEVRQLDLPDGTKVILDTRSAIDVSYSDAAREVSLLRGRAFFYVADERGRPFTVRALGGEARDIGTAFVVSRTGEEAATFVIEGEVEVTADGRRVNLTAGQGAHWREGDAPSAAAAFDESEMLSWRTGTIVVNRRTFGEVLEEVSRYRRWPVVLLDREVAQRTVNGVVRTENLDEGIEALARAQGLRTLTLSFATILY